MDGSEGMNDRESGTVRVACCQVTLQVGDVEGNRDAVADAVCRGAASGTRVIVVPELSNSGYSFAGIEQARAFAEPVSGPTRGQDGRADRAGDLRQVRIKRISPHSDVHADRRPELYAGVNTEEDST